MDTKPYEEKMKQTVEHFAAELKKLRTGRAHASMLESVMVMAYGTPMPMNQVATVSAPESQLLQVSPFDPSTIQAIASAIRDNQALGLNPSDDGRVVRVPVPALTEDRRRDIVKIVGQKQEEAMVTLRGVRHDAIDAIDKAKKDKLIGEDDAKRLQKDIDDAISKHRSLAESMAKVKETEIMTV